MKTQINIGSIRKYKNDWIPKEDGDDPKTFETFPDSDGNSFYVKCAASTFLTELLDLGWKNPSESSKYNFEKERRGDDWKDITRPIKARAFQSPPTCSVCKSRKANPKRLQIAHNPDFELTNYGSREEAWEEYKKAIQKGDYRILCRPCHLAETYLHFQEALDGPDSNEYIDAVLKFDNNSMYKK